jgi:hypothetical protein
MYDYPTTQPRAVQERIKTETRYFSSAKKKSNSKTKTRKF